MLSATKPVVFVVTATFGRVHGLSVALPNVDLHHISDVETLLREAHMQPPAVALLFTDIPGTSLAQALNILRQRPELASTRWIAVGSTGLGELLEAGADALMSDSASAESIAMQVRSLLQRSQQHRDSLERISQLQRRMDDWEHEERIRDQLVHMLVHDLKNPIAAVMGLLEVVEDDTRIPADSRELLRVARDEAQHLLHLTVNMLDVRKIQAGKMNLRRELMFSPLFQEIVDKAQGDVGSGLRDRQLNIQIETGFNPVQADPEILRRVIVNLLSNALKHTTNGGRIEVTIDASQEGVRCRVRDNGEGIPEEDIPNLFAAFEQSRLTLHGRFDTGMGLAFCKMAIEEHGGRIWVESRRGAGSLFTFVLPYAQGTEDDEDFVELLS